MTPEGKVKEKIKAVLRKYNVYWHMPVQNGMGAPSLDFVCCTHGKYFVIEAKAGNKMPTPRQYSTIREIQLRHGHAFVVNEVTGTETLEAWLKSLEEPRNG
jgi:hypothetical protein